MYNETKYLESIDNNKIDFNLSDIKGHLPLHILLLSDKYYKNKLILKKFIENTNLNLQDNKRKYMFILFNI